MQARAPKFVTLNNRKVKVQQWQLLPKRATLTTLVSGDAAANELLAELGAAALTLQWDDGAPLPVRPELTHHRVAGSGPATVHRIEVTLWFGETPSANTEHLPEDKLDRILQEIQWLRAEVAELRSKRRDHSFATPPLPAGQTLLDFDIDTDEGS